MATVLLAEDEAPLRMMMGYELKRAGHQVTLAPDGQVAAEHLAAWTFDVLVTDLHMPRQDGFVLLETARTVSPDTEVVILTSNATVESVVEAFRCGNVFDYLLKPLHDIRDLSAVVHRAAERRGLRRENDRLAGELRERIAELENVRRDLAEMAETDGLTGLYHHKAIHEILSSALAAPEAASSVAVVLMDMDGFKLFNDTYGHPVGDRVLVTIAQALRDACADEGTRLGRCGGDEFMVVMPGRNAYAARDYAERVRRRLRQEPFLLPDGRRIPLPLCFGVADTVSAESRAPETIVSAADGALYRAKARGGNRVFVHTKTLDEEIDLPAAVSRNSDKDPLDDLFSAIQSRDRYTRRHADRVTRYALHLARALEMGDEDESAVRVAGMLHDIGNIGIPEPVLRKPGPLTGDEFDTIKRHVGLTALIEQGIPRLAEILEGVASHHERWDGGGYPRGLQGDAIPLFARLLSIADAYAAMTVNRPYRVGMSPDDALTEIERGAGGQFDPALARVFIAWVKATGDSEPADFAA